MILESIVNKSPIVKGWSGDQKYCAVTADGTKYLLRVSSIDRLERKRREYEKMSEVSQLDIPMCLPVEFGICDEGVYSIQSWIDGVDAEGTENGIAKGVAKIIIKMYRKGYEVEQISDILDMEVEKVREIIENE